MDEKIAVTFENLSSEERQALFVLLKITRSSPESLLQSHQFEDSVLNSLRSALKGLEEEFIGDS